MEEERVLTIVIGRSYRWFVTFCRLELGVSPNSRSVAYVDDSRKLRGINCKLKVYNFDTASNQHKYREVRAVLDMFRSRGLIVEERYYPYSSNRPWGNNRPTYIYRKDNRRSRLK